MIRYSRVRIAALGYTLPAEQVTSVELERRLQPLYERLGLVESIKAMLNDVDHAIVKLDEGTYGWCSQCGKAISAARLQFRPASNFCVDCKSKKS